MDLLRCNDHAIGDFIMRINVFFFMLLLPMVLMSQDKAKQSASSRTLPHFEATGTMTAVLRALKEEDPYTYAIGFEMAARGDPVVISINVESATIETLLKIATLQDPRYTFRFDQSGVIEVYPKEDFRDKRGLLDVRARSISIHDRRSVKNYIREIATTNPTFRAAFMAARIPLPEESGAGSCLRGNYDQLVNVSLQNATLRDVLTALSAESLRISRLGPVDLSATPLPPVGWVYNPQGGMEPQNENGTRMIDVF
jgi:hypothetical protein